MNSLHVASFAAAALSAASLRALRTSSGLNERERRPLRSDLTVPTMRSVRKKAKKTPVPMFSQSERTRVCSDFVTPTEAPASLRILTSAVMFPEPKALTGMRTLVEERESP